jgi:hypothetical protein
MYVSTHVPVSHLHQIDAPGAVKGGIIAESSRRPHKRPSSPEQWELKQLMAAGVLSVHEHPHYDEEIGGIVPPIEEVCAHYIGCFSTYLVSPIICIYLSLVCRIQFHVSVYYSHHIRA